MKAKTERTVPAIQIGATEESVSAARGAIMDILNCAAAGDTAKVAALDALKSLCSVSNVSIQNCNFDLAQK